MAEKKKAPWKDLQAPKLTDTKVDIAALPLIDLTKEESKSLPPVPGNAKEAAQTLSEILPNFQQRLALSDVDIEEELRDPLELVELLDGYTRWIEHQQELLTETRRKLLVDLQRLLGKVHNRVKGFREDQEIQSAFEFLATYFSKK